MAAFLRFYAELFNIERRDNSQKTLAAENTKKASTSTLTAEVRAV